MLCHPDHLQMVVLVVVLPICQNASCSDGIVTSDCFLAVTYILPTDWYARLTRKLITPTQPNRLPQKQT